MSPTRADVLALRDAFVAAGRALFDALDVFALAAGEAEYDRSRVTVSYGFTEILLSKGAEAAGWGVTPP